MESLNFDLGLKTFSINGSFEIAFNPSDWNFVQKIADTFEALSERQEKIEAALKAVANMREFFATMCELDKEMRDFIDGIFNKPLCENVFGDVNLYSIAGGAPVWFNFLITLWDTCDDNLTKESKIKNPKIAKYLDKYAAEKAKA